MASTSSLRATVSVVIPIYNGERFVAETLESVFAQSLPPHEVIVVDDGSTDRSLEVVRRFPAVRIIEQVNAGPSAARNAAIRVSTGEFVAPVDHDDLWPEHRLEVMVGALRAHPEAGYVVGAQQIFVEPGSPLPYWLHSTDSEELERFRHERGTGLLLMRRSTLEQVGLFDESMTYGGEDVDWVFRCADLGVVEIEVDDIVLNRRIHGGNMTMSEADMQRAMFAILRKRAQRRRGQC